MFDNLPGAEHRKFCSLTIFEDEEYAESCPGVAVGELTVTLEDGTNFTLLICDKHRRDLTEQEEV